MHHDDFVSDRFLAVTAASLVLLLAMLSLWFLYPIWLRARQQRRADA